MVKEIPLSSEKFPGMVALVDDGDFESVMQFRWFVVRSPRKFGPDTFYAARYVPAHERRETGKASIELMHRFLIRIDSHLDHKDRNGLNNQRSNLRPATGSQNQSNRRDEHPGESSRFRGVYWYGSRRKWRAKIAVNRKYLSIGYFQNEEDAAKAYDAAALQIHGEFANLNFPIGQEP